MAPERGFTLLELLVVVTIIGLLVAIVGPRYFTQLSRSEVNAARAQIDALHKALEHYRLDTGRFPDAQAGFGALLERPPGEARWNGPYLDKPVPPDPWGRPFVYRVPGAHGDVDVLSLGRDGAPGGTGEDADLSRR